LLNYCIMKICPCRIFQ